MDFDKLLNPVAEYLDFFVDFVLLRGIEPYSKSGSVSPKLLSFFFIGLILSLIIKRLKRVPTFGDDSALRLRKHTISSGDDGLFGLSKVLEIRTYGVRSFSDIWFSVFSFFLDGDISPKWI